MRPKSAGLEADELTSRLERLEPEIRTVLVRFGIPVQDAEDILHDTLVVYLSKRDSIAAPNPWLLSTLRNHCLVYWRRRRRSLIEALDAGLLEEVAGSVQGGQERTDLARDLSSAVAHLPDRCRSILRLRYGLDCAGPEIAERLGYRPDAIRQATLRCLSALSRQLLSVGYDQEVS